MDQVAALSEAMYPQLREVYEDIHRHPELSFQEVRTATKLAREMRALGFDVTEKVGRTGLVAMYRNGEGPTVLVRTELDALPMEEKTGLPYASTAKATYNGRETFVAHSCGHDLHMATWLGTARALVTMKDHWRGTLMFIGQPAEETGEGAKAMMADGLFERFAKPDFAFALHTSPVRAHGVVGLNAGPVSSNFLRFQVTFKGRGGHGSAPDKTLDPIVMASKFIVDVQTIVSLEKDPMAFGVLSVGAVQAGSAGNIIPDTAVVRGTIRSYDHGVMNKLVAGLKRTALAQAQMAGAPEPEVSLLDGALAIENTAALVDATEAVLVAALGPDKVQRSRPITPSEDFSVFVNAGVPALFFFLGVNDPQRVIEAQQLGGRPLPFNHSPYFAPVPEPSIKTGVRAMSLAVLNTLRQRSVKSAS